MLSISILTTLLLSLTVSSTPIVVRDSLLTLPITKRINAKNLTTIVQHDQARAQEFRGRPAEVKSRQLNARSNVPIINNVVDYIVEVGIGSPPTPYKLLIDTGSSNTWVGAERKYTPTLSSVSTGQTVSVTYGSGSFSGDEYTDTVTLGLGLTIQNQSIGAASRAQGFDDVDGILGIGPVDLTAGTVSDGRLVPTVTDNLFLQHLIESNIVSVSFAPPTSLSSLTDGELTFGGTDSSKYQGQIHYSPITSTPPASEFWGIHVQSIYYGSTSTIIQPLTAGIVDTGTTLILLASDVFDVYRRVTGAVIDNTTGLLRITLSQYHQLESLYFNIDGAEFELTPNAQIFPRSLNEVIGGSVDDSDIYLIVADLGSDSGQGLDFILGMSFLERFYSVFDTTNHRVGLAMTANTFAETN
ncbi:peptidase A1 family protein [Abortiporus biennis]